MEEVRLTKLKYNAIQAFICMKRQYSVIHVLTRVQYRIIINRFCFKNMVGSILNFFFLEAQVLTYMVFALLNDSN